ncbi:MAG: DNA repair protein RecN [Sphingobacteriales bacterium]|nr:MAG: DNA repair protein RecN [Sphingobacteriales bacterium]TAF80242.1 MAG: DNA repair protein RecN [Sphingobacteriales bacterium]
MLLHLSIKNYALIDNLEIHFDKNLNIVTGETGAGKSIILGALSLILGQRADSKYFFNQQKKCVIEGFFNINQYHLNAFFDDNDLDYNAETILRREISTDGKSRAFINDSPVNLNTLKNLGQKLIDIHSQHANLEINQADFQLMVVDAIANHQPLLNNYNTSFKTYKASHNKLKEILAQNEKQKLELDYLTFQFTELENAKILPNEQEILENELNALTHAEEIKRNLLTASMLLQAQEQNALLLLETAAQQLQSIEKYIPNITELYLRLKSSRIEVKDIASEIENLEQITIFDDAKSNQINERLGLLYTLQKKHHVTTNSQLLLLQEELSIKLNKILFTDEAITQLQASLQKQKEELITLAKQISNNRKKAIPDIEKYVQDNLFEIGMPNAKININQVIAHANDFDSHGIDTIKFLFSANKGQQLSELSKIASGGELSRLMLAIKSLIAKKTALPTIIFDEIDTGISGEVANRVGKTMELLAQNMQVIAITHLPQIAVKGQAHYFVFKEIKNDFTYTQLKRLNHEERVLEIAKMLSGENPKLAAMQNARELLN